LITLENIDIHSKLTILENKLKALRAKESRFFAQQAKQKTINFPPDLVHDSNPKIQHALANELHVFQSKRKSLLDKVELLNLQSQQTETQLASLQNEVAAINKSMTFINNQLQANMALSAKGFSGKNQVWENQRVLSEKKERLNGQQAYIEAARVNVTSLRSQISALENEYTQEGADQLAETRREIAETEQTMRPIREQNARTTITAPVAGQVINLQVSTTGGVIASGQPLLEIVPVVDKLIVELKVNTLDIDSVHVDQDAKVQLLSYSRLNTPLLQGKVVYISGDVLENPIKPGEYYYLCHLQVSQASLQQLPDYVKLYPGMPVTAFIQTRSRTLSTYLLEPIADNMARNLYRNH
jgi:membrane fusion protein, epimerase transport system